MSTNILDLPKELLFHITSYLRHEDLATFCRVCKSIDDLLEPLLWKHVELHPPKWHRICQLHPTPAVYVSGGRQYHHFHPRSIRDFTVACSIYMVKAYKLLKALQDVKQTDQIRFGELGSRIQSFSSCLDPGHRDDDDSLCGFTHMWRIFPFFVNLVRLEIEVGWQTPDYYEFLNDQDPLPKLRYAKLEGYVPVQFVHFVLRSAATLEGLDLGLLDFPVGSALCDPRTNPPPRSKNPLEFENHGGPRWHTENSDDESEEDLGAGELTAPRSLIWVTDHIPSLPKLQYIRLCKTSFRTEDEFELNSWDMMYSHRTESRCFEQWKRFLCAVQSTIKFIVLDQRPVYHDSDSHRSNLEFMKSTPQKSAYPFVNLMEQLFAQSPFPQLNRVDFYGVLVDEGAPRDLLTRLITPLELKGVEYEFHVGTICRFRLESGEVESWGGCGFGADLYEEGNLDEVLPEDLWSVVKDWPQIHSPLPSPS